MPVQYIMKNTMTDYTTVKTASKKERKILPEGWPRVLAHRGACTRAPENTLAAFRIARELGARGIELDVHLCASGELVVTHDHWLDRVAGIHRRIEDMTMDEIRQADASTYFDPLHPELPPGSFAGEGIPTLDEVFETVGKDMFLDIELKTDTNRCPALSQAVAESIRKHNRNNCIVSSFNPFAIIDYRKHGDRPIAAIYCPYKSVPFYMRHREALYISRAAIKKPAVETARASKRAETGSKPVLVWTVDSVNEADALLAKGVASIITNRIQDFARYY